MDSILLKLERSGLKNRFLGIFGNKCWSGGGVKAINEFQERVKWEKIGEPIEAMYSPQPKEFDQLTALGQEMARAVKASPR
jgi:flavorubredoxin